MRKGAFIFNRILGCQYHKWVWQRVRHTVHSDLMLFHRFEQGSLRFGRGAVDLIGKDDLPDDGTRTKFELILLLVINGDTRHITRQHVGGKLDTVENTIQGTGQAAGQHCLPHSRHIFDYNVEVTRKVVEMAHRSGVTVEGELGCLGNLETGDAGEEDGIGAEGKLDHSQMLTDPEEAATFVKATQLDALAIAIGTSHGAYKFSRPPTGDILAISRVKEIHVRIPNTHLVMHGSSSVPQDLLAIINQYGGKMKQTYGVPVKEIQEAIKHGVRKINIDTDIRMAMTGAVRKFLAENPEKFDAREWLKPAREAAKAICKQRYLEFGCEGQGAKIKGVTLVDMAARYAKGELAQVVK